ncbi:hypothetical protein FOCG_06712 [Fusarium oxysporum f. sp. radicis-lycopersici 26381]|uniref:Uncharacterized protein n=1 Tax=Fusarium oxysporum Fo47 TaxID=660027 RepID=W9KUB4_FUSOX|nr:hypothetical protein FOZG_03770 [Fusarium oxysporum Fo47]EWZ93135.1 hypothetical protein FOWG_06008 [Fusarium oxysporum f. sp. lycopersici MN25]EXL53400.1 hypothetical protein FOCG_06712 [Fusarium oxysporum f. sp. radicis-lycopersici 26381]
MFCYCVGGGGVLLPTEPGLHRTSAQNACLVRSSTPVSTIPCLWRLFVLLIPVSKLSARQGVAPTAYVGLCAYVLHRYKRFLSQYRCFFRRFDIFRKSTETCCSLSIPGPPMC